MTLKIGNRLFSTEGSVEVIVVAGSVDACAVTCAGVPMSLSPVTQEITDDGQDVPVGKRYEDPDCGLELLVTKGGTGPLAVEGRPLTLKAPKRLPASD